MANEGGSQKSKVMAALIVGMVLGVAGSAFVAWFVVEKNPASFGNGVQREQPKTVAPMPSPAVAVSAPVAASGVGETQQYEFYKVLPDKAEGGTARKQPAAKPAAPVAKPISVNPQPAKAVDTTSYFVQAGSFQNADDADKLKAKLAMSGMEASVQKADVAGKGVWYRVRLGPYKGQAEANAAIAGLKLNGITNATAMHAQ
ncbi:MAG: SPOR domain-containing protein [Sideroxydans sp.]|nr:SPOR domain-containing protein [Sideroxydans sp.]